MGVRDEGLVDGLEEGCSVWGWGRWVKDGEMVGGKEVVERGLVGRIEGREVDGLEGECWWVVMGIE